MRKRERKIKDKIEVKVELKINTSLAMPIVRSSILFLSAVIEKSREFPSVSIYFPFRM